MVDAIASAAAVPVEQIRRAAMYAKNLGAVARAALTEGVESLAQFQLEPLSPIAPMLAQTAADVGEALTQLGGEVAFEWKMDGARIQLHKAGDAVRIYTRSSNEVTAAVPEIVETVQGLPAREMILDGEAIAFTAGGRPHPFQVTMRRFGRKLDVEKLRGELPMQAFFFDCLHFEGESLTDRPARERFAALARAVPQSLIIPRLITSSAQAAQEFYDAALAAGHEGLMAKSLDAPYEAGNRGASWLKIKRAHTLDLVVLAAEWGHGRRTGKLSNLHLGALDPATGEYVMLGKTFKGLTDALLEWQTQELQAREISNDRLDRVRAAGAGRRDRVQRSAGEPALSGRPRAAPRAREALSRRQARRRGGHDGDGQEDICGAGGVTLVASLRIGWRCQYVNDRHSHSDRTEAEASQPQRTPDQLHDPDRGDDVVELVALQLAVQREPGASEQQHADQALRQVVGQRHLADGAEVAHRCRQRRRAVQQADQPDVTERHRDPARGRT